VLFVAAAVVEADPDVASVAWLCAAKSCSKVEGLVPNIAAASVNGSLSSRIDVSESVLDVELSEELPSRALSILLVPSVDVVDEDEPNS
jgi:hypothetical protein